METRSLEDGIAHDSLENAIEVRGDQAHIASVVSGERE
jgi:hypothetical protein